MSDNKNMTDKRDASKIDSNDPSEVEHVHGQFPHLTHEQVYNAIKAHGPSREKVMEYLKTLRQDAKK